jgi:hypothetical protein
MLHKISMLKYSLYKMPDAMWMWIAHRLPRRLVYWSYIRVGVKATTGRYGNTVVPEIEMMEALRRWDAP